MKTKIEESDTLPKTITERKEMMMQTGPKKTRVSQACDKLIFAATI